MPLETKPHGDLSATLRELLRLLLVEKTSRRWHQLSSMHMPLNTTSRRDQFFG